MKKLLAVVMLFGASFSTVSFADAEANRSQVDTQASYQITCRVRNGRGVVFQARGRAMNYFRVQQRAMNKCYASGSRRCRLLACY